MSNTTYTDFNLPAVNAAWLNDVNRAIYVLLGNTASAPLTRAELLTNLGLPASFGTMASQNANSVAITGGSITGITDLAIADGGTGASTAAQALINLGAVGRLIGVQVITTPGAGVYTPTAGTTSIVIEALGAGGAGGGAGAAAVSQYFAGAPGGGGGLAVSRLTTGFAGAAYVIGAGGTGVSGGDGNSGGNTTFLTITGGGGGGGTRQQTATVPNYLPGGAPGTATGGNLLNIPGGRGAMTFGLSFTSGFSGVGGGCFYTPSGAGENGGGSNGQNAPFAGTGGGGSFNAQSVGTVRTGGNGGNGMLVIYEYA